MAQYEVRSLPAPPTASQPRRSNRVQAIVLHSRLGPALAALGSFTAPGSTAAPHFYIDADGAICQLVPYRQRAARHSGLAAWNRRARNIDLISVGVMLEHRLDGGSGAAQLAALHWLLDRLLVYYGLEDDAIVRWQPPQSAGRLGSLEHYLPAQPPPERPRPAAPRRPPVLSDAPDPQAAQRLWQFLAEHTYQQRGGTFHLDWSFHLYAAKFGLGAPLAPSDPTPIQADGRTYDYQPFARDTICNEGRNWDAVQSLNAMLGASVPAGGLARALIEAGYRASLAASATRVPAKGNQAFHPDWTFHQVALQARLGPPIGGNYATADGKYAVQVFAGDTLYTPRSEITRCRRLSETPASDPAYAAIWAETYAAIGAPYDANAPFQQFAAANKLGAPLGPPRPVAFEGASYTVQVFALDTLYAAADGAIKRLSALPLPAAVAAWQPKPVAPPPPPPPPGGMPERASRLANLAIGLLGSDADDLARFPQLSKFAPDRDIVCADLVTFCLSEVGVKLWGNVADPTGSGRTGPRAANYYRPDPANQGMLREVTNESTWLPGDILIYGKRDLSVDRAYHVNLYVGPFTHEGRARDVVNSSLGDPLVIALNKERCVETHCSVDYTWTRRVRVIELEREFGG
ncbi:N-acetylmuramoyl-L-alanine amidase [Kouleothrix sp.]|uniref:N-acetylmuramoyl-L-alanine amidase n=1 Tax=Kouleothrix sp. TaxID=2779161 RepID=UPI0039195D1D